jgi:TfoX/Sxy family transcriptional regulator of competence genes
MPPSDRLVARVQEILGLRPGVREQRMFGAYGFTINGHLACAVRGDDLMVRIEPEEADLVLAEPHVGRLVRSNGKPVLPGFVLVDSLGLETDEDLAYWVDAGANLAASLPPK